MKEILDFKKENKVISLYKWIFPTVSLLLSMFILYRQYKPEHIQYFKEFLIYKASIQSRELVFLGQLFNIFLIMIALFSGLACMYLLLNDSKSNNFKDRISKS